MKKTTGYSINFAENTITLTKAFAQRAKNPATSEFRERAKLHKNFPELTITLRTAVITADKETHGGLTIKWMTDYIKNYKELIVANLSEEVFDMYLQSKDNPKNPLFAPYYGDFIGCPPIYLWASTAEILRDDSIKLYEKLRKAGHSCNLYLRNGMMHTWMIVPYFPESQKDLKRMKAHLEDVFSGKFQLGDDIVRLK